MFLQGRVEQLLDVIRGIVEAAKDAESQSKGKLTKKGTLVGSINRFAIRSYIIVRHRETLHPAP